MPHWPSVPLEVSHSMIVPAAPRERRTAAPVALVGDRGALFLTPFFLTPFFPTPVLLMPDLLTPCLLTLFLRGGIDGEGDGWDTSRTRVARNGTTLRRPMQ